MRMSVLRFFMFLSLVVWIGGIIFFAFVLAPAAFSVLPTRHIAGQLVTRTLAALHWMGLISGVVFLATSMINARAAHGTAEALAARHMLVYAMLLLTVVSQFGISPRMHVLRNSMGEIDNVAPADPARVQFNALHAWSTRLEGAVLLLGLTTLYLTARHLS
jgi:uncharacterized membrane protein